MRWVADYLFKAGWNVYSTVLAGHAYKGAAWPTVNLKSSMGGGPALAAAFASNPDLAAAVKNPGAVVGDPAAAAELFATLTSEVPQLAAAGPLDAYMGALEPGGDPDAFDARFDSTAGAYGEAAEAALRHVAGLPGPVVAVGSSVGGAVALWAGGIGEGRVTHVLACAPLLRLFGSNRQLAMAVGPLGVAPEQGWSADNRFPMSCFTGALFGGYERWGNGSVGCTCSDVEEWPLHKPFLVNVMRCRGGGEGSRASDGCAASVRVVVGLVLHLPPETSSLTRRCS